MNPLLSPATFLPKGALELIDAHAGTAEVNGHLLEEVVELAYREGWFKMLAPKRWGGQALPLPEVVRLEEALAFADGSLGWTVTLCSGAGWFAGFFPSGSLEGLLINSRLCIAGSGSVSGEAHIVTGGYRVTGRWAYASGIRHATAVTANCVIWKDGMPLVGENGNPLVRPFLFLPGEVRIHDDWNAMGLVATGSHGFSVKGLTVPAERMFVIDAAAATDDDMLYRYPFLPLAEVTLTANLSGMGLHFLDCCEEHFGRRTMPGAERLLAAARSELASGREEFYRVLDRSWEALVRGTDSPGLYDIVGAVSAELAARVRDWAGRLYPYAGLGAVRVDTTINRVWRDLHTAGQHPLLVDGW
jgi:alkylation response protein AidB-like acyl-CoA dehydrogenase